MANRPGPESGSTPAIVSGAPRFARLRALACAPALLIIASCAILPDDGPAGRAVTHNADAHLKIQEKPHYTMVDVDVAVVSTIAQHQTKPLTSLQLVPNSAPSDTIGVGDVLSVAIVTPGAGPIGVGTVGMGQQLPDQSGGQQNFPHLAVESDGSVQVPFAGIVHIAGLTPPQAAAAIRRALVGKLASPQVLVSMVSSVHNTVTIVGEVKTPGRVPIGPSADKLTDVIAEAGGATMPPSGLSVTVVRDAQRATIPLSMLMADPEEDIRVSPHDQIRIVSLNRRVNVFGAVGKASQIALDDTTQTLADTLGKIGGLDDNSAEPKEVLLFRFERRDVATALGVVDKRLPDSAIIPVVYRVDLRDPSGYFIANKFIVEPDDLVFVPRANLAEIEKFLNAVNLAAQFLYEVSITRTIGL